MSNFDEIEKLWLEFYELPFPLELAAEEVKGICVISLDTFTAGCIDTFIGNRGLLDKKRISTLKNSFKELQIVVENLDKEAKNYFEKLLNLTNKVIQIIEKRKYKVL